MQARTSFKTFTFITFLLLAMLGILAACGQDNPPTAVLSSSLTPTGTRTNNGAGRFRPITGTIAQYDATSKQLTISLTSGSKQTFNTTKASIILNQKLTQQQFSSLLTHTGIVVFAIGKKDSTGAYTAQTIVASTTMNGIPGVPGGNGNGNGNGNGFGNGTPFPRNGNGNANANARVFIQHAILKTNQLSGDDTSGKPITVSLSSTTILIGQTEGTGSDLQPGQVVSITAGPAPTSGGIGDARQISIGQIGGGNRPTTQQ
jgi:hypothetical protein